MNNLWKKPISLRVRLISGIFTVALVGFVMLLVAAFTYQNLAYENQRNAITELIGLKITSILDELSEISKNLGLDLQTDDSLRNAIRNNDLVTIQKILDMQFNRYFVSAGILKLKDIYVFDGNFDFITSSTRGQAAPSPANPFCSNMVSIARKRVGVERLKPMSQLCTKTNEALFGVIVPVGSLNPFAYMLIVSDPAYSIIQLEQTLGDPVKIIRYSGEVVYQSSVWPEESQMDDYLVASHTLRDPNGSTIVKTLAVRDIEPYRKQLFDHAFIIVLVSTLIFCMVIAAVVYTLKVSLRPLDELQNAANRLSKGDYVKVSRTSVPEIDVVIQSFNVMAEEITNLIRKLQNEIFERKKTEENLKKHQYDLSLARDQAFAASRAKSVFLANMSHELRTPLNAIIGYSDMLFEDSQDKNDEQQLNDLTKIKASGNHLLSIINNILDYSKIEAGQMEINLEQADLTAFIDDITTAIQPIVLKNSNDLKVECPANLGVIHTDISKLRQSVLNLLDNACKFTQEGEILLRVEAEKLNNSDWIHFSIHDTGIGISDQQSRHLFSEFTQADSSTTKSYQGTGLGLALSQRFCELLGGHITFTSQLGKGSKFTISIPRSTKIINGTKDIHSASSGVTDYPKSA
ncbi:ATP-binding protein [Kaarinaea lacus]